MEYLIKFLKYTFISWCFIGWTFLCATAIVFISDFIILVLLMVAVYLAGIMTGISYLVDRFN